MKILFLASRLPHPPYQGDRVRAFHQIRLLSRKHEITLVCPTWPSDRVEEGVKILSPWCRRIELLPASPWRQLANLARFPLSRLPLQTLFFCDPRWRGKVAELHAGGRFDLVHAQLIRMAPLAEELEGTPKVLDLIDALTLNMRRRAERDYPPISWTAGLEADRIARYEESLSRRFDRLLLCTAQDAQAVAASGNAAVVANGVDPESFKFFDGPREARTIAFTGRLAYFPNADAAAYFADEIFPLVLKDEPLARFLIIGADPPRAVRRLARRPGIEVWGDVADMRAPLQRAAVAVAPMRAGSGMQFKLLEAMAAGAPVVASPHAARPFEGQDGTHLLVADQPQDFARAVVRLFRDQALAQALAKNARALVEKRYSWEHSVGELEKVYADVRAAGA